MLTSKLNEVTTDHNPRDWDWDSVNIAAGPCQKAGSLLYFVIMLGLTTYLLISAEELYCNEYFAKILK